MNHIGMEWDEPDEELSPSSMGHRKSRKMRRVADLFDDMSIPNRGIAENVRQPPSYPWEQGLVDAVSGDTIALTGTAALGKVGQTLGLMDVGECEDSYMFRVSLPGVERNESEFSCEVSDDGKVTIRGVTTTGENTVSRFSKKFEMLSRNLCPPGHFSISFQLAGPVNPRQFTGSFGTDGILEGIVMKKGEK